MTRRIAVIALLLAALAVLMFWPRQPRAACVLPACDLEREFFSDATFTTQVGEWNVTCQGVTRWGHSSCYYFHTEYGPCNPNNQCSDVDFTCTNGTITGASNPAYVGQSCACYPVF